MHGRIGLRKVVTAVCLIIASKFDRLRCCSFDVWCGGGGGGGGRRSSSSGELFRSQSFFIVQSKYGKQARTLAYRADASSSHVKQEVVSCELNNERYIVIHNSILCFFS